MGNSGGKAQQAVARARYEGLQQQAERDRAAADKLQELERENRTKLEEAYREKADSEKRAYEEKAKLEREKMDMIKESAEIQLRTMMESNTRLRETEMEAENRRREIENKARENEIRMREENEQKRDIERAEAKAREEQKQREANAAITEANRSVLEMKDKAHADITRLVTENQRNKDEIVKENLKAIEAKDAANAEKLDKLTSAYQTQVKETQELAQQREDALHLERKAVDEKYRKDMENMNKLSKEERDKMTDDYHKMIEAKDNELSKNQQDKEAKIDALNKNHLVDLREAHDNYTKLQKDNKIEMERLHKEKEEILRESAAKERASAERMLKMKEENHEKLLTLTNHTAYLEQMAVLRNVKCNEELAPINHLKSALIKNVTESYELWAKLEYSTEDLDKTKDEIFEKSQAMKRNISDLLITVDVSRTLGEQKKHWKEELKKLDKEHLNPYATASTTNERFREIEDACGTLKEAILDLSDMAVESLEALMSGSAQGTLAIAENLGAAKAIKAAVKESECDDEDGVPFIEEN